MSIPTQGEIVIIIKSSGEGEGYETADGQMPSSTNPEHGEGVSKNPKEGKNKSAAALAMAGNLSLQIGKQALNAAVANIGLATGDYYAQAKAQQTMQAAGTISALAMSASNIWTFAATSAGMVISAVAEDFQQKREREIANYEAAQYAKRLGYTVGRK